MKTPTISHGEKLGFLIYVSKKVFCSSPERKMEGPAPEIFTMNIDEDFIQFKKENEKDWLGEAYVCRTAELRKKQQNCFDKNLWANRKKGIYSIYSRVPAKKITLVIFKRSLKEPRHLFDMVLDSYHFDQYLK